MRSTNIDYIPRLDHLRLLAALLVFGFHLYHQYAGHWRARPDAAWLAPIVEGHTGVSLFFVLSGFIFMTIALRGEQIDYRGFLRNRALRILPLFLAVFFVAISIGRDRFVPTDILYLLFTNLGLAPTSWHFATGPAWSISVEFTFYLIFPFLARFTIERGPRYLLGLLAMVALIKVGAYFATERSTHMFYSTLIGRFDQFLIGMLAAIAHRSGARFLARHGTALLAVAFAAVWAGLAAQGRWASFFDPDPKQAAWIWWGAVEALAWATLVIGYLNARMPIPGWIDHALTRGGTWSFSIYMWHTMVIFIGHAAFGAFAGTGAAALGLYAALLLPATLAFAWLSYQTIESPFLRLRGRYTSR